MAAVSPAERTKTPMVPMGKLGSLMLNWNRPFKKRRISLPTTHTPIRTLPGAPGGTSPLGMGFCNTSRTLLLTLSARTVPSQASAKR